MPKLSKKVRLKGSEASYIQKSFAETVIQKIFEINYSFHVKKVRNVKSLISIFQEFFGSIKKNSFYQGD